MIISNFQRIGDTMQSCNKEQIGAKGIAVHDDDGGVQCRCWCSSPVRLLSCRKPHLTAVPGGVGLASVVPRVPILVVTSTLGMPGLAGGRVPPPGNFPMIHTSQPWIDIGRHQPSRIVWFFYTETDPNRSIIFIQSPCHFTLLFPHPLPKPLLPPTSNSSTLR